VNVHFQITTDGFSAYKVCVPRTIGKQTDFTKLIKFHANPKETDDPHRSYSPSRGTRVVIRRGNPDPSRISTSYVKRTNLSVRLFNRRFTRLTLGYSKKFEYLIHSINLFVFHYNFIKQHSAYDQTPAMAADLVNHPFAIKEFLLTPD